MTDLDLIEVFTYNTQLRRRERAVNRYRREVAALLRRVFRAQRDEFLRRFARLRDEFAETVTPSDWLPLLAQAFAAVSADFETALDRAWTLTALSAGNRAIDELALGFALAFDLANPRAVAFQRAANDRAITQINEATRNIIRAVIAAAVEDGSSYTATANALRDKFNEFAGEKDRNGRDRADRIAIFEIGNRFEGAQFEAMQQVEDAGVRMGKFVLTAGDDRVSDEHDEFAALGTVPLDFEYDEGLHSPFRSNCRCVMGYERLDNQEN